MTADIDSVASCNARKYLRLQGADNVGPVCARKLVDHFGTIDAVFAASLAEIERVDGLGRLRARSVIAARSNDNVDRALARAADSGARIICPQDDEYPKLLNHIPDPPVCLYVRGRLLPEDGLALAIVGSRRCTRYGIEQSERFGAALARAGFTIVSGMARGADGAAHRGAISAGGRTVAVLGCGLGHLYPAEHAELAEQIVQCGALVSELPVDTPPERKNFLPRNRIIVGMSLGVIVTECAKRSGALASARVAGEYNREVFAVPGQISNPLAHGSNALIRDGQAKLIMGIEDVLDELGDAGRILASENLDADSCDGSATATPAKLDDAERAIINVVRDEDTPLERICDESALTPAVVAATLTKLQMKGLIVQRPGNLFARRRKP